MLLNLWSSIVTAFNINIDIRLSFKINIKLFGVIGFIIIYFSVDQYGFCNPFVILCETTVFKEFCYGNNSRKLFSFIIEWK